VRRRSNRPHASHERWLVSYADFITLLFAFFVVLYATSQADQKKQAAFSRSIDDAFRALGIFPSAKRDPKGKDVASDTKEAPAIPMNIVMGEDVLAPAQVRKDLERIGRELQQRLSNEVAKQTVSIQMGRDGLIISLREAGFFASGSAAPRPDSLGTLRRIAGTLTHSPYDLRVEGHTDNVPIHNQQFDSNWELSSARATNIARLLLEMKAIRADQLSAAGYAEFHPIAPNSTPEGRARNRRVDLVVLPRSRMNFSGPTSSTPAGPWRRITDDE
jgi:chemotaxis protein MotB